MHGNAVLYQVGRNGKTPNGQVRMQCFDKLYKAIWIGLCVCMYTYTSWHNSATCVSQAGGKYSLPCRPYLSSSSECPWAYYGLECCPRMISAPTEMNAATFGEEENCHLAAYSKYFKGQESNTKAKQNAAFEWIKMKLWEDGTNRQYWDQDKWPNLVVNMDPVLRSGWTAVVTFTRSLRSQQTATERLLHFLTGNLYPGVGHGSVLLLLAYNFNKQLSVPKFGGLPLVYWQICSSQLWKLLYTYNSSIVFLNCYKCHCG